MNGLAQRNQLNEVADLQHSVGSLFSRSGVHWLEQPLRAPQRIPLVAVSENARRYALKAELPGVGQEDVKINLDDDTGTALVAAVQRSRDLLVEIGSWHHGGINE